MTKWFPLAAALLAAAAGVSRAQAPAAPHASASAPVSAAPGASAPVPDALLHGMRWRLVGPYRAGWATVGTGVPGEPNTFYFGGAGGGVWKTIDAGRTWRPLLQHESASAIGALAVAPSNGKVLYAGTGQADARYDIMAGDGVYRSDDGGEHWTHVGLDSTRHIGRILVDPSNPDRVLVAALGHVFAPNPERGVFLTTDGGAHWRRTLFVNDSTGVVDLAWDPTNPSVVYAAAWQEHIHPWLDYFQPQGGAGSGIYKSVDGGEHWTRLTSAGLPSGPLGRVGLGVARGTGGRVVYATIVAQGKRSGIYRSGDAGATWEQVSDDGALASSYFGHLTVAPDDSNTIYVMGQSIRRSTDGGRHYEIVKGAPGGDDYHYLWIDPSDATHMIAGSDQGAVVTVDGMKSWSSWYNQPTGQFYHLAVDDRFPYHIYSGQQDNGTVEIASRGPYGVIEERDWHPVGGDERDYMVPKPGNPDIVFGSGLGGHLSRFDDVTRQVAEVSPWPVSTYGARPTGVKYRYTWITPLVFSPVAPHALYLGAQVLFRSLDDGNHWTVVSPDLSGKRAGATGCADPAPAAARACGFGVIYTIAPSPVSRNVIWVGTDDGLIQVTTDGGAHWRNVTPPSVPAWGRIDAIAPSALDARVAYAAIDTHRLDHFAPLLLETTDGGASWRNISAGIPAGEYTTVVRADPVRRGLLYAGTNRSVYVSLDDGAHWQPLARGLPTTWVRDLLVHDGDLIAATQGRGIWVLDDVTPLREATATVAAEPAHLFRPAPAWRVRANENRDTPPPPDTPLGENPPAGAVLDYWIGSATSGPVTLTITDAAGHLVRRFSSDSAPPTLPADRYFQKPWTGTPEALSAAPGAHRFVWDLRYPRPAATEYEYSIAGVWEEGTPLDPRGALVLPGSYTVTLHANGHDYRQPLQVMLDPRVRIGMEALRRQLALAQSIDSVLARAVEARSAIERELAARKEGKGSPRGAEADSLAAIAGGPAPSLESAAGVLASLVSAVQSADAAPTDGERGVLAEYRRQVDALIARWHRVNGTASASPARKHEKR